MRRRNLLKAFGAGAAGLAIVPALRAGSFGAHPFQLGVAAGDPAADGFVIWTRLVADPLEEHGGIPAARIPVDWEVATDDRFANVVRKGQAIAHPELGHSVHVEVQGLLPHRHYWYRFHAGGETSEVGSARCLPAPGTLPARFRFAVAGCQHYEHGYYNAWSLLAAEPDLDLVFHYGDYIYESPPGQTGQRPNGVFAVRRHANDEPYSLGDYRRRYAQYKSDPQLRAAHAACAFAPTFDDHEIDNNWVGDISGEAVDPEMFQLRRQAAMQAWYEHMPVRRAQFPLLTGMTAHRRLDVGRLVRMHVLDTRTYRTDQPCEDGKIKPCLREARVAGSVLGTRQERWLEDGLGYDAVWNVVAQQMLVMPFDVRRPGDEHPRLGTDIWDGYRGARDRLLESFRNRGLRNVVVVSGDYHRHIVGEVPLRDTEPEGEKVAVEFLATSISSDNPSDAPVDYILGNNPHVRMFEDRRGYHLHEMTPRQLLTEVKSVDQTRTVGGRIGHVRRFVVTPDAARLHEA
jgi:alkaline phosphatase D